MLHWFLRAKHSTPYLVTKLQALHIISGYLGWSMSHHIGLLRAKHGSPYGLPRAEHGSPHLFSKGQAWCTLFTKRPHGTPYVVTEGIEGPT